MSRAGAVVGIGSISRTILGYAEGLISKGLDIRKLVVRVVIGVYYLDMRLVTSLGIEFGGACKLQEINLIQMAGWGWPARWKHTRCGCARSG